MIRTCNKICVAFIQFNEFFHIYVYRICLPSCLFFSFLFFFFRICCFLCCFLCYFLILSYLIYLMEIPLRHSNSHILCLRHSQQTSFFLLFFSFPNKIHKIALFYNILFSSKHIVLPSVTLLILLLISQFFFTNEPALQL